MNSFTLNRFMFMSLMVMVTVVGLGKVSLPFLLIEEERQVIKERALTESTPRSELEVKVAATEIEVPAYDAWKVSWSPGDLIPSAEAAVSMALAEERQSSSSDDATRIIEMRKQKKQLNELEKSLTEREEEVKIAEKRAKDKIAELEALEARIQALLTEEKSIKDKKIKRLTAVYEGMKAERAAPVIAQMQLGIVVKIFSRMSEKQVGKILSFLSPQKAVVISQALTKRISAVSM